MIVRETARIKRQDKIHFHDTLGYLHPSFAEKSYMSIYHRNSDYVPVFTDGSMGITIRVRVKVRVRIKTSTKFVSSLVKEVGKIAQPVVKAVKGVGEFTEDVYDKAKSIALKALPAPLRDLMSESIMVLEKTITNPVPTVIAIAESAGDIANNIVRETTKAAEVVYHDVARPAFRVVRNVANETVFKPVHKVIDVAVLPILPKSIRENVEKIIDVPEAAFAGKLTDKKVVEGLKSYYKLQMLPMKTAGKFANATINTLKKDAILGPFLDKVDLYSGGLLTSAQSLAAMPDDLYHERDIDWKARLMDGLKIYLTVVSAGSIANYAVGLSANAVGTETGLNQTPLGRGIMAVGVSYGGAFANGNLTNLAIQDVAKNAVISQVKGETVKHAVANGWVDDKFTAQMILSAGGKFYDAAGTDKTLMSTMSEIHDKEFQKYINYQIERKTGLPITSGHLVDVYNTDWSKLANGVADSLANIKGVSLSSSDGSLLAKMGKNFVDEIKRVPQNFSNISQDVLNEIGRTPENMANFASAIAKEADRTPENIAEIANNIAREGARGASNVIDETARTPENVSEIASNIGREIVNTDWGSLITKYGPDIIPFLQTNHPSFKPGDSFTPDILEDIDLNYYQKRSGIRPGLMIGGLVGVLALGYFATQD
jgi:methyl-accepting chemotaxis protein